MKARWDNYVKAVLDHDLDICHITLALTDAFCNANYDLESALHRIDIDKVIHIEQHNVFNYMVQKPRRVPFSMDCVKPQFQRTISSVVFEGFVENKARHLGGEFTFRDFLELKYDSFRRIVVRLKRKGIIIAHPMRSIPQKYILTEKLSEEQKRIAANRVQ